MHSRRKNEPTPGMDPELSSSPPELCTSEGYAAGLQSAVSPFKSSIREDVGSLNPESQVAERPLTCAGLCRSLITEI